LFLGVLYHAPDMVGYLQRVRSVTRKLAIVETLVDGLDIEGAAAIYYPAGTLNNDSSNWWGPNVACVTDILRRVGFSHVECRGLWDINTIEQLAGVRKTGLSAPRVRSGRAVFHAYV
jgi:hypothetical protein